MNTDQMQPVGLAAGRQLAYKLAAAVAAAVAPIAVRIAEHRPLACAGPAETVVCQTALNAVAGCYTAGRKLELVDLELCVEAWKAQEQLRWRRLAAALAFEHVPSRLAISLSLSLCHWSDSLQEYLTGQQPGLS